MKKGLLSLLALALTVVGCQNYDDQFEELTSQITSLQSTVDGLTGVSSAITALQSTVGGIQTAIAALPTTDSVADLSGLATQLDTISSTLAALQASLADVVTAEDLATISNTLGDVEADVHELLTGSSAISQNVYIRTSAELDYSETVILTGENSPSGYIVTGNVIIDHDDLSASEIVRANALTTKIITVIGNVTATIGDVDFSTLAYIQGDYDAGSGDVNEDLLANVTGDVDLDGRAGVISFASLATVGGNITISNTASVTEIDLDGVTIDGNLNGGNLTFANATDLNLGTALFTTLSAPKATDIDSARETFGALDISAGSADTIDFLAETVGTFAISTNTDTLVHFDSLDTAGTITATETGAEFHIPALTSTAGGAIDVVADVVNASGLVTVTATYPADFNGSASVLLGGLLSVEDVLTLDAMAVINLPDTNVGGAGEIDSSTATNVTIAAFDAVADVPANTTRLVLTAQDIDVTATAGITDLTITAATGADVDVTADDTDLDHVTLDGTTINTIGANSRGIISVALANTSTNTINAAATVATVTLSGTMVSFTSDASTLAEFNNTATFLDKPGNSDTPISIHIHDSALTSLDLSSMEKVAKVDIQNNTSLTSVLAPTGATNLLTANADANFVITGNSITATYTNAVAAFPGDGINPPTAYEETCIYSPSLATWKDYIAQVYTTNTTITYSFDIDTSTAGLDNFAADSAAGSDTERTHSFAGRIDTAAELAVISASACD